MLPVACLCSCQAWEDSQAGQDVQVSHHSPYTGLNQAVFCSDEMRLVHQLLDTIPDDGDMERMVVLDPPVSMSHREVAVRCKLGSKSYCPGETLFR